MNNIFSKLCNVLLLFVLALPLYGEKVLARIEYFYADDGTLIGKAFNGRRVEMTTFGETDNPAAFFTGKPMIDELGYSFLFRDYNPAQGKWTTTDPLGYPDRWNNLAYENNGVTSAKPFEIVGESSNRKLTIILE